MWKYILAWFPMIVIAIANGLFREKVLASYFKELQAHQMSTITILLLFGVYVWMLFKLWIPSSANQAIWIGLLWLFFTITFEFLFGHYVVGHSWGKLLNDYNLLQGRVWILVLIWITILPYLIYQIQN